MNTTDRIFLTWFTVYAAAWTYLAYEMGAFR